MLICHKNNREFDEGDIVLARTPGGLRLAYFFIEEMRASLQWDGVDGADAGLELYNPEALDIIGRACDVWRDGRRVDLEGLLRPLYAAPAD